MTKRIVDIINDESTGYKTKVSAWVRTFRNNQFIALSDGSTLRTLQAVVALDSVPEETLKRITTGAAIEVEGSIEESLGKGQRVELIVENLKIIGDADAEKYPLQPKRHSLEFLREIAHLRFRTNTFGAVFRIRHHVAYAIHKFFNDRGFYYLHSPIITGSDAEGAGEMFRVTTLDISDTPKAEGGEIDFSKDFFGKETNLTVSGQLEAELAALATVLEAATGHHIDRLMVYTDSKALAQLWHERREDPRLVHIRQLTSSFKRIRIRAIPRLHNQAANALAKQAATCKNMVT